MKKLQTILDVIRKENPETRELSLGCHVVWQDNEYDLNNAIIMYGGSEYNYYYWTQYGDKLHGEDIHTIIGHPLYPHHLLVALNSKFEKVAMWQTWDDGGFVFVGTSGNEKILLNIKEPLEPQLQANPELVETLYKLLVE